MSPRVFWLSLRSRGVRFVPDGDSFRVQAHRDVLTDNDKLLLRRHKQPIVAIIGEACQECGSTLYTDVSIVLRTCTTCRSVASEEQKAA